MLIKNLIDSPQWCRTNGGDLIPTAEASYELFAEAGGPNADTSMEVANQFSATSDFRAFSFSFQLIMSSGIDELRLADILKFLEEAWFKLNINRQNVFNIAASAFENVPMVTSPLTSGAYGVSGNLNFTHTFGKEAPIDFPGGQSFQFLMYSPTLGTGNTFRIKTSMQGYEVLRSPAEQAR